MKVSLIITTYNWPEALELVLLSVKKQVILPDDVIIADDGSKIETRHLIQHFQKDFPVPLIHVWHEDKGFRRSSVLNLAISKSDSDYIIQLDGDCIIHKFFVSDHIRQSEKNTYLFGSRVTIQESLLPDLYKYKIIRFSYFKKGIKKRNRNIHSPFLARFFNRKQKKLSKKLRGCNLSYWKEDFLKVNGYNEDMIGWGREDSELIIRMMNNGVFGKRLKFNSIIYHIWHKENSRTRLDINHAIQQGAINRKLTWCSNGIDKYLNEKK